MSTGDNTPASREKNHVIGCGVDHELVALHQVVMARMEDYVDRCESSEVDIKELEYLQLAPDEQDVDIRHIALHARGDRHQRLFHSQHGRSETWETSAARWDEHERMLVTREQKLSQTIEK